MIICIGRGSGCRGRATEAGAGLLPDVASPVLSSIPESGRDERLALGIGIGSILRRCGQPHAGHVAEAIGGSV